MPLERLDNLVAIGKLKAEAPAQTELDGLCRSGSERLRDSRRKALSLSSRFDLVYNAGHALALAAVPWLPLGEPVHRIPGADRYDRLARPTMAHPRRCTSHPQPVGVRGSYRPRRDVRRGDRSRRAGSREAGARTHPSLLVRPNTRAIPDARVGGGSPFRRQVYFTAEKAVGVRIWLEMLATIGPSASDLSRASCHSGSATSALHFCSRSASDSQATR